MESIEIDCSYIGKPVLCYYNKKECRLFLLSGSTTGSSTGEIYWVVVGAAAVVVGFCVTVVVVVVVDDAVVVVGVVAVVVVGVVAVVVVVVVAAVVVVVAVGAGVFDVVSRIAVGWGSARWVVEIVASVVLAVVLSDCIVGTVVLSLYGVSELGFSVGDENGAGLVSHWRNRFLTSTLSFTSFKHVCVAPTGRAF